jgi:RNA polymerase sigma factor (sigma-70 family)
VVRRVARAHRLRDHEVEELLSAVQLKLVENDYDALRRFEGRSSLGTYLRSIVTRHLLDERAALWGKWRPSVYAKRLGATVMQLELLMTRDGLGFRDAVQVLRSTRVVVESDEDLHRISRGFPARAPRRFVDVAVLQHVPVDDAVDRRVDAERQAALALRTGAALQAALHALAPQDQLLLKMHFEYNLPLSKIARTLQVEQRPLYRRKDQALALLGRELARQGVRREDIVQILGADLDFTAAANFSAATDDLARKPARRPSK